MTLRATRHALRSLGRNLAAGLRLALFMPVRALAFRVDGVQLVLLVVVTCLVDVAGDRLRFGADAVFDARGGGAELASVAMLGFMAIVVAAWQRRMMLALALVVTTLAAFPVVQVVHYLPFALGASLPWLARAIEAGYLVVLAWIVAILVRAVAIHVDATPVRRWTVAAVGGLVLALPLVFAPLLVEDVTWFDDAAADAARDGLNAASEPVLAAQSQLLDDALGNLADHEGGAPNLYFVGYAPDGGEVAWTEHMERVRKLVDERLDTKGRSLVLRNHAATLLTTPLATVSNLRETLNEIAAAADVEEDVLLLYIGARGARDGEVAGNLPPLDLVSLTPAGLKSLLDDAGIEWRIIVVAACHAGAYADVLEDDHTAVVTASSDGPSFGCEGRGDPTFFGDALFADGFARGDSLPAAFAVARERVAARERERGLAPSSPMIRIGAQIAPRIRHLRRFGGAGNTTARLWRGAVGGIARRHA